MFKVRSGSLKFSADKHNLRGGEAKAWSYAIRRKFLFVSIHQQDGSTVYQWSRHIFQGQLTFSCLVNNDKTPIYLCHFGHSFLFNCERFTGSPGDSRPSLKKLVSDYTYRVSKPLFKAYFDYCNNHLFLLIFLSFRHSQQTHWWNIRALQIVFALCSGIILKWRVSVDIKNK